MKAERRHELQNNTLAQALTDLPLYLRFHANKILIGVIIVCGLILLIRHRMNATAEAKRATTAALQGAEQGISQLQTMDRNLPNDTARAQERKKIMAQINTAIEQLMQQTTDADDPAVRAEAKLAEGDMYWTLANLPMLPGAATQPGLSMTSPSEYLNSAEAAYQAVLKSYASQKVAKATALFGLAAVEENRRNFDKAKQYYDQMLGDSSIAVVFQDVARRRESLLSKLKTPIYIGTFSSTQPTSAPSTTQAAIDSTQPSISAAALLDGLQTGLTIPSTRPATQPTTQPQ